MRRMDYLQIRMYICRTNLCDEWPFLLQVGSLHLQVHRQHRLFAWSRSLLRTSICSGWELTPHGPTCLRCGWAAGSTTVWLLSAWCHHLLPPAGCLQGTDRYYSQSFMTIPCLRGEWGSEEKHNICGCVSQGTPCCRSPCDAVPWQPQ